MNYRLRQQRLQGMLLEQRLSAFVITHPANLRYLCGYTGSNGLLLFADGKRVFFTDGRYTEQAHEEIDGPRIVIARGSLLEEAIKAIVRGNFDVVGFEAEYTTVATANAMRKSVRNRVRWKPTANLVMQLRIVKEAAELKLISDSVRLGAAVYEQALLDIRPGVRESEVAGKLEYAAREAGADGMSFDTIVAAGRRSALPHGRASAQLIARRGFVVVDSGVILRGYCSDMTRTVYVGRASREERKWYDAVLEAQLAGIAAAIPGKMAGEVDQAARQVLDKAGLGRYFTHSTGHGVGLEIHEPPRLGKQQTDPLKAGMVITIEPGIYVPGKGGIRIEDMVVVTDSGPRILTPVQKQLVEI